MDDAAGRAGRRMGAIAKRIEHIRYRLRIPLLGLLLLAGFGLRVWGLHLSDLTFDEVATVFVARRPLGEVISYVMGAAREHPPFYYLLMSLWMQVAGETEFAIRYPSVLISVLSISWAAQLGQQLFTRRTSGDGGLWVAALIAVAPFSVWAGRNGRMYALVMLLSMMIVERWLHWVEHPSWNHWLVFAALSMIGAMTHYYLVLLWLVQGLLLCLLPRETKATRKAWIATAATMALAVGAFVVISPGVRAMLLEVASRFPVRHFRRDELGVLFSDLYLWGYRPEFVRLGLLGLGLTVVGWAIAWTRDSRNGRIMIAWGLAPLVFLHFVPESLESRYLIPVFPALMIGLAALSTYLPRLLLRASVAVGLLCFTIWRLPEIYNNPDTTFSNRVRVLHIASQPGDGLVMNGPWPGLLLTYYEPPANLEIHGIPAAAPPGFDEAVDVPRLAAALERHPRLWVSYGAIHWADPEYRVSRWLAENAYCVFERYGLALYVPPPDDTDIAGRGPTSLDVDLRLIRSTIDRQEVRTGDTVRVLLEFEGTELNKTLSVRLALLDSEGTSWQEESFDLGPLHQPTGTQLPKLWAEQRGFLIQPGVPPGAYNVAFKVYRDGVPMTQAADFYGWIAIGKLTVVRSSTGPDLIGLLPNSEPEVQVSAGNHLAIVGVEPYAETSMQGYVTGITFWWRVQQMPAAERLYMRLAGKTSTPVKDFALGPSFYPASVWQQDDVIRQSVYFELPEDLPAGEYVFQVQTVPENTAPLDNAWVTVAPLHVETRDRSYHAPLLRIRRDISFGDMLQLKGFRLGTTRPKPGEQVKLTVYWKALQRPDQVYAVFNHLRAADGTPVWQGDTWPQNGIYTTNHWLAGEVVSESYTIELPPDLPPGTYTFYTGVYDPTTSNRLPAITDKGHPLPNNELELFEWTIKP